MSFFISDALANTTAAASGAANSGYTSILFLVVFFLAFYLLVLRPQNKRQKEKMAMINSISKGDEIVTAGGMMGKVAELDENYVELEIAPNVKIKMQRSAIAGNLPKGTLKF